MFDFKKIKLDDGTRIKVERVIYDKIYNSGYNSDQNSILKEYIERESGRVNYNQGDITKELKLTLKLFPKALLGCLAFSLPFGICMYTGLFKYAPLGTGLFGYLGVAGALGAGTALGEDLSFAIDNYRRAKVYKKTKVAIEKQLEKSKKNEPKEEPKDEKITKLFFTPEVIHREKKEIEYEVERHYLVGDGEDKKSVVEKIKKTTTHSPRYEAYKEEMIRQGANPELFNLQAINDIIDYIIDCGDYRVKMEGRSPIYYKNPNEDGTFDICGRMAGPNVTVVYKMEYCDDENPDHYIVLKKYRQEDNDDDSYDLHFGYDENYKPYKLKYKEIYINREGNVVDETFEKTFAYVGSDGLLSELHQKELIKSMV